MGDGGDPPNTSWGQTHIWGLPTKAGGVWLGELPRNYLCQWLFLSSFLLMPTFCRADLGWICIFSAKFLQRFFLQTFRPCFCRLSAPPPPGPGRGVNTGRFGKIVFFNPVLKGFLTLYPIKNLQNAGWGRGPFGNFFLSRGVPNYR